MKLSSHEEYGLRCLLQVARQGANGSTSIPEISRKEGISMAYVAKLMRILRQGGFVRAARGKAGGYTLALPAERICVGDALTILGGPIYADDFCNRHAGTESSCTHSTDCSIRSLWRSVQTAVDSILRKTTIGDLLRSSDDGVGSVALQIDLVSLHDCPERDGTSPIAK
ncbi:MAG: RrF2 family transcriptional regulator [Bryobacteraceae bacterium]